MYRQESNAGDRPQGEMVEQKGKGATLGPVLFMFFGAFVWQAFGAASTAQSDDKTVANKIRAKSFVVVDDSGKELGEFGVLSNGQPGMIVRNKDKSISASIGMDQGGMPRFAFENDKGDALLELGLGDQGETVFIMRTPDGKRRLGIIVLGTGSVGIGLYDSEKRNRCMVSLGADGHPKITLRDDQGKARVSLMVDDKGTASLVLLDRTGAERIVFQVDTQGNADAAVFGPDGKPTWTASKK